MGTRPAFRHAGKAADVRKDDGSLAADAAKGLTRGIFQDFFHNIPGHVAHQGIFHAFFPADVFKR